jgi:hypothetical protein
MKRTLLLLIGLTMTLTLTGCCTYCTTPYCPAQLACGPMPDNHCPPPPTYTTNGPCTGFWQ